MEEEESVEFKTVKACAGALTKTLAGAGLDTPMMNFLKEKGFITETVRLNVIDTKSIMNIADKTNQVVEGIKVRIDLDKDSYKVLLNKFDRSGVLYEPIVKMLTKEYKQSAAAIKLKAKTTTKSTKLTKDKPATTSGKPKTATTAGKPKTATTAGKPKPATTAGKPKPATTAGKPTPKTPITMSGKPTPSEAEGKTAITSTKPTKDKELSASTKLKPEAAKHPPYSDMILAAISTLKEPRGSSAETIIKYVKATYSVKDNCDGYIANGFKRLIEKGTIVYADNYSNAFKMKE